MTTSLDIHQAVIFAGGLGTRLKPFTETKPKPMYPFFGKPFLEYLILQVKDWGIKDIIILLGYLPEKIINYFGDGSNWAVNIKYVVTPVEYDTGYRLKAAEKYLEDTFLMMYCDNICPIDFNRLKKDYLNNNAIIQVSVYSNEDNYTKNNLHINDNGLVELYDKKRQSDNLKGVDIGYALVSKKALELMSPDNENFEAIVYPKLVEQKKLFATITKHRYYSIGSYERIHLTEQYLSDQKYIFLDRDGVINERPPKAEYICSPKDFKWLPGAKESLKRLCEAGYFIILISNHAGIARKAMSLDDFYAVQEK
ncbi:MAG: NTP transferase domain-containing protein, partial [Coriobacteriales bacterium]|nr:NTP transferase domain-containing protein [Coriobacteriales bacterium]